MAFQRTKVALIFELFSQYDYIGFNAYAVWWIRQRILQAINEKD